MSSRQTVSGSSSRITCPKAKCPFVGDRSLPAHECAGRNDCCNAAVSFSRTCLHAMSRKNTEFPRRVRKNLYEKAPCGYLSTDPTAAIVRVNRRFTDLSGGARTTDQREAVLRFADDRRTNFLRDAFRADAANAWRSQRDCPRLPGADGALCRHWSPQFRNAMRPGTPL